MRSTLIVYSFILFIYLQFFCVVAQAKQLVPTLIYCNWFNTIRFGNASLVKP